ncbi:hypothetical protein L9F63_022961, partial [Diploptera punctata]
ITALTSTHCITCPSYVCTREFTSARANHYCPHKHCITCPSYVCTRESLVGKMRSHTQRINKGGG